MEHRKLDQKALAQLAEVTQPTVSFWLNQGLPKPSMSRYLADKLDVSWIWLMYGEGDRTNYAESFSAREEPEAQPKRRIQVLSPMAAEVLDQLPLEAVLSYKLGVTDAVARLMLKEIEEGWPSGNERKAKP